MFKTELHCHTAEVSDCARATAKVLVKKYLEKGYTSVVLTNHLSKFTFQNARFDHSAWEWQKKIDYYMNGFYRLEEEAAGKLYPILGCELRLNIDGNDYLLYGVTEEFLRGLPDMMDRYLTVVRDELNAIGGLIYQAHPFRNLMQITNPSRLDGVEVYNGTFSTDSRNWIARAWAEKYGLRMSSGSDFHASGMLISGGIETEAPITNREELLAALKAENPKLLTDYEQVP